MRPQAVIAETCLESARIRIRFRRKYGSGCAKVSSPKRLQRRIPLSQNAL
jgi:hypothetical protein